MFDIGVSRRATSEENLRTVQEPASGELKRKWGLLATAGFLLLFRALTIFGAGALIEGRVIYWGFVLLAGKGREGDRKDELDKASYADIVLKLKQKFDKTEPDLVQRFRFSQRNQQPDESNEDFVQSVKLQAEFCGFGAFKDVAIMDRVLAGLLDGNLKENLLKEEGLTLDKMDKFITTWDIAKQNKWSTLQPRSITVGVVNHGMSLGMRLAMAGPVQRSGGCIGYNTVSSQAGCGQEYRFRRVVSANRYKSMSMNGNRSRSSTAAYLLGEGIVLSLGFSA
ncbi:conserved hypothetical protein [Culex quinquefasciatus]|uniref:Uncharacterized protein n=1 Tax=Culex quinquefasciatus TaxID=7176 RepID=B0WPB6_CULQU|nr:conserved hypothetical protein [Culex quinquefasciatus]|eukprot:XP_001850550.1 conserved hypothetical protein [Culex quinquefasciatus]